MRVVVVIIGLLAAISIYSCKTGKNVAVKPLSPHTDTLKMLVNYQTDTLTVFVKRIVVSDSLFGLDEGSVDFNIVHTEQKDSILFITISSYFNCKKDDFKLYQSKIELKTYPVRLRCRISKGEPKECEEKPAMYTLAVDIRDILSNHAEANLMFTGFNKLVTVKRYK